MRDRSAERGRGSRARARVAGVDGGGPPAFVRPLIGLPGLAPLLRVGVRVAFDRAFRSTVRDRSVLTPTVLAGYRDPLLQPGVLEALSALSPAPDVRAALAAVEVPAHASSASTTDGRRRCRRSRRR